MAAKAKSGRLRSADPILDWRLEQLIEAGYSAEDALMLAPRNDVDLHQAVALLRKGCPVEVALRILI